MVMDRTMTQQAKQAASFIKGFAHPGRLAVLCALAGGEQSAGALLQHVSISQTALSQHLARLRADGLVTYRRQGTTLYYRLKDPRVKDMVKLLHKQFCKTK